MRAGGYIYAIGAVGTSYVKIGSTRTAVENRLKALQIGQPFPLQTLAAVAVETNLSRIEHQVHKFLAEERRRGEWFDTPMDAVSLEALVVRAVQYLAEQTVPQASETKNLGTKIRQRREQLGLSQQELARRLGMTQARISEIESGARPHVNLNNLRNLARTLGVSADYLIGTWEDGEAPLVPTAAPPAAEVPAAARRQGRPRGRRRPAAPAGAGS